MHKKLLFETIKIQDGEIFNLEYHQARCEQSRREVFCRNDKVKLSSFLNPPKKGLFRCRIFYDAKIQSIEYISYTPKIIKKLKIVSSNITYNHKYADREELDALLSKEINIDEVIIEKDGYLSDTTIANIAFYDGKEWFTPKTPLLKGTMRAKLLDEGFLQTKDIKSLEILKYKKVALMNAMIGFRVLNEDIIIEPSE